MTEQLMGAVVQLARRNAGEMERHRPTRALQFLAHLSPAFDFCRRFFLAIISLPFIVLPSLLPLSSLLLMLPAVIPDETVTTDAATKRDRWAGLSGRAFAVSVGLASVIALLAASFEIVTWLGISGILRWIVWIVIVYLLDLALLAAVGKVPLRYNIRNLMVRWRITILTAIAFTVVVALLTVMLAFVTGMYKVTEESGQPANVLILADGSTDEVFSSLGYGDVELVETENCPFDRFGNRLAKPLQWKSSDEAGRRTIWASKETYAVAVQPLPGSDRKRFVQVRGVVDPTMASHLHDLSLLAGSWFSPAGVLTPAGAQPGERDQIEAVLGAGVAREFGRTAGKETLAIGDTFDLADRTWVLVGLMNSDGTTFGSEVWAKQNLVAKLFNKNGYNSMVARVADDGPRSEVSERAATMAYHLSSRFTNPKVNAQTETDYFNKQSETNKQFLYAIIVVAAFMALGGIFGVMNTMFASIAQRTQDIGVMRILGFKRWQILVSFLLESLAIAMIGGLFGCALGAICDGWSATSSISSGQSGGKTVMLRLAVDAKVLLTGVLFTLVMGRLGGLIPALSAMRLKILDTLR
jgi:ABC-type antimicrobial peptide transport system permease subunit